MGLVNARVQESMANSSSRSIASMFMVIALSGCAPFTYTYYAPTAVNARFASAFSCAGPHNRVIFPPERQGVQIGVAINNLRTPMELSFVVLRDMVAPGFRISDEYRKRAIYMEEHAFDLYSPSPVLKVTFQDGAIARFSVPYLEGKRHRKYLAGMIEGIGRPSVNWPLPTNVGQSIEVELPEIFVDGTKISTSPIHFKLTTKTMIEGINC